MSSVHLCVSGCSLCHRDRGGGGLPKKRGGDLKEVGGRLLTAAKVFIILRSTNKREERGEQVWRERERERERCSREGEGESLFER